MLTTVWVTFVPHMFPNEYPKDRLIGLTLLNRDALSRHQLAFITLTEMMRRGKRN